MIIANVDLPYDAGFYEEEWNRVVISQEALSLEKYVFLSDYFHCTLDYLLKGADRDDVSNVLPSFVLEILQSDDEDERELLLTYMNLYSKIKKHSDTDK